MRPPAASAPTSRSRRAEALTRRPRSPSAATSVRPSSRVKPRQVLSSLVKDSLGRIEKYQGLMGRQGRKRRLVNFSLGSRVAGLPSLVVFAIRASHRPRSRLPRILIIGKKMTRARQRQRTLRLPSPASPSRRRRFAHKVIGPVKCTVVSGRRPLSRVSLRLCERLGCGHVFGLFSRGLRPAGPDGSSAELFASITVSRS